MQKTEVVPPITAEQNRLSLDEARAKATQIRQTFELRRKLDAADIRALEIQRDRALNAWKHAESNADKMRVVSPIDGMVVLKSTWKNGTMGEVQEGEEVRSGLGIMEVIDSSAMQVRARVNQADVSALRVGQPARITLDSYPGRAFTGRLEQLSQIGTISTMSNRVRTFLAVFSIEGSDPHLMPDLAAAIDMGRGSRDEEGRRGPRARRRRRALGGRAPRRFVATAASPSLPTALVARTTFVDFLQLRGEIRPVRSVVLTAPSAGSDLQIVELAGERRQGRRPATSS